MARNICILSDGTGQAGGSNPIDWTNVYRLYKATRAIAPERQLAFYDPGLGSHPDTGKPRPLLRRLTDLLSQATGYGITRNIIDCYTAALLSYRPGDRLYLFGFSRGAYTVRSLGGTLGLCGIPPGFADVMRWDEFEPKLEGEARAIATEAVTTVYQERDEGKRLEAAAHFRERYRCGEAPPYFIGVWDTVRALGIKGVSDLFPGRHHFNNDRLDARVVHGRQALSIDENRKTFKPEIWDERAAPEGQIVQRWFAGVHTDVGGGYGLAMGLADLTLGWITTEATTIAHPLLVEPELTASLRPDALGKQHDELRSGIVPWLRGTREAYVASERLGSVAQADGSVDPRFRAGLVPVLDDEWPYRPLALKAHRDFSRYYAG